MNRTTLLLGLIALAQLGSLAPAQSTLCGTTSARQAAPFQSSGCGADLQEAMEYAEKDFQATCANDASILGLNCAECEIEGECIQTVNSSYGSGYSKTITSNIPGMVCVTVTAPNGVYRVNCTSCD